MRHQEIKQNSFTKEGNQSRIMFIDMNSFFASCEQQDNVKYRGSPIGIVTYSGENSAIIAPSIEAKKYGVKTGMRLSDAKKYCPSILPVLSNPKMYRDKHKQIIAILKSYCDDVTPKSIDEAILDMRNYKRVYPYLEDTAKKIKKDIYTKIGKCMLCSIGIAPNSFLAKLATNLKKPDGLVTINERNLNSILQKLSLTDLPGISYRTSKQMIKAGITTPLELKNTSAEKLRIICHSIVGVYWYMKLNCYEMKPQIQEEYKSFQTVRTLTKEQRKTPKNILYAFKELCMRIEKRMMKSNIAAKKLYIFIKYYEKMPKFKDEVSLSMPEVSGTEIYDKLFSRIYLEEKRRRKQTQNPKLQMFNSTMQSIGLGVSNFIDIDTLPYNLFDNTVQIIKAQKTVYDINALMGENMVIRASELEQSNQIKDAIGFGSIKDLHYDNK